MPKTQVTTLQAFLIVPILTIAALQLPAIAATRIRFAQGSYCGSYSGNFSSGKEFVLGLSRGQTLTTRNTGGGRHYNITVNGPRGRVNGSKTNRSTIAYTIPAGGDYYIYMDSSDPYSAVEFCAY
jgi:hypothetical protein